ncbi:MAG: HAD hydrolase family protein [Bacteroidales bacterium]|jgi:3-deoxy-D-manno-octulosonate 8-phosphate phosphatase (KDO 8-P phosphatase)|nr:HAD hydrolase family protein [Bacteroidales bacterium]
MSNYKELLRDVDTFILDYDGVLTDGNVILMSDGDALRTANVKDGYALQLAVKNGYRVAIISGGYSESMLHRFKALKIKNVFLGVDKKIEVLQKFMQDNNLEPRQVLYMGDDIPDYEAMLLVGVPTCPADASEEIKAISKYISHRSGGKGCVRDIIEQVMKIQGKWMNDLSFHW